MSRTHDDAWASALARLLERQSNRVFSMRIYVAMLTGLLLLISGCSSGATPSATSSSAASPYSCIPPASEVPKESTSPIDPQLPRRIAIIGDSYTSGSPQGGSREKSWAALAIRQIQQHGINIAADIGAEGASGYVSVGHQGHRFSDQISRTVRADDSLVVLFGSINDLRASSGDMARATCDTLREARLAAPSANLLVIGPPWPDADPPTEILQKRDIIRDRAAALSGLFIDPIQDGWFAKRPDLIGSDGKHPTDAGHEYMAQQIEPVVERLIRAPAAG